MTLISTRLIVLLAVSALVAISVSHSYAISSSTDKTAYSLDDTITVSGNVGNAVLGKYVGLQIRSPGDLVQLDQFMPSGDGTFSKQYVAKGAKWSVPGTYKIIVAYEGQTASSSFQFNPEPSRESQTQTLQPAPKPEPAKLKIPGFPEIDKSPQYYYDRYQNEPAFKEWFDSVFHGYTIQEIVGYKATHIESFPDETKSRQYYLDRYNNEEKYKAWFDSQFPGESIYEFFGISEEKIPRWIKDTANQWARGEMSDSEFASGIKYLVENNFITVSGAQDNSQLGDEIPDWIRNNASWWASGKITEGEFLNAIKYLIEKQVIILD